MAAALLVSFLQNVEGLSLEKYKDSGDKYTIGFGHLILPHENYDNGITKEKAIELLDEDADIAVRSVARLVKVDLAPHEHAAVASWLFNLGEGAIKNSNTLASLNRGERERFAWNLLKWDKVRVNGVLVSNKGLRNRRQKERLLFLGEFKALRDLGVKGV